MAEWQPRNYPRFNQEEQSNRAYKALQILEVLGEFHLTAAELARLDHAGWVAATKLAAERCGTTWDDVSERTKKIVIHLVSRTEKTTDPWKGF